MDVGQIISGAEFLAADCLLSVFFFVIGLDLIQELKNGDLRDRKHATLPALAAFGGVLFPALIYLGSVHFLGIGQFDKGWAIPTATDVAFSLFVLNIFRKRTRKGLALFLLVLAVVDDIIGIVIIAVAFSKDINAFALLMVVGFLFVWCYLVRNQKLPVVFLCIIAIALWISMFLSGIHPTIAGVLLGITVPAQPTGHHHDNLADILSKKFTPFCNVVVVPVFAITSILSSGTKIFESLSQNQATTDSSLVNIALIVAVALVFGKPVGIMIFTWIGQHLTPLQLFHDLKVRDLFGVSVLGGIGFTVSFLVASLSFADPLVVAYARIGVLAGSITAAILGSIILFITTRQQTKQ